MQIILLESFDKLGNIGDTVEVKDGYARNFLLPQKKALRANKENKEYFEKIKKSLEEKNKGLISDAKKISEKLVDKEIIFVRKASETGQLYGSVSPKDISSYFSKNDVSIPPSNINLTSAIKKTGIFEIKIKLHAEVSFAIKLNVATSEESAKEQRKKLNDKNSSETNLKEKKDELNNKVANIKEDIKETKNKQESKKETIADKNENDEVINKEINIEKKE